MRMETGKIKWYLWKGRKYGLSGIGGKNLKPVVVIQKEKEKVWKKRVILITSHTHQMIMNIK
jgi:hypothetical protein